MKKKNKQFVVDIVICLLLLLCLFYQFPKHNYPYHHDEWQHLALSIQLNDSKYISTQNPYVKNWPHHDFEPGFHSLHTAVLQLFEIDPFRSHFVFTFLTILLTSLSLFYCILTISKKKMMGYICVFIYLFLKSNVNILGKNYFVPISLAMSLLFFVLAIHIQFLQKRKISYFILFLLSSICLFVIHPPSAVILFPGLIISYYNDKKIRAYALKNTHFSMIFLCLLLFCFGLIYFKFPFEILLFEQGWGKLEIVYFIPYLYGISNTIFALIGIYYAKKEYLIFVYSGMFSLLIISMYSLFSFTILIPYVRTVQYIMLFMIPLSTLGVYQVYNWIYKKEKIIAYGVAILFIIGTIYSPYTLHNKHILYEEPVVTQNDIEDLIWIKENSNATTLMVPTFMSSSVYPLIKMKVVALQPAQLGGGNINTVAKFYNGDCQEIKEILLETKPDIILSSHKIKCTALNLIRSENNYIYEPHID